VFAGLFAAHRSALLYDSGDFYQDKSLQNHKGQRYVGRLRTIHPGKLQALPDNKQQEVLALVDEMLKEAPEPSSPKNVGLSGKSLRKSPIKRRQGCGMMCRLMVQ
jgi:hypothetical protein